MDDYSVAYVKNLAGSGFWKKCNVEEFGLNILPVKKSY